VLFFAYVAKFEADKNNISAHMSADPKYRPADTAPSTAPGTAVATPPIQYRYHVIWTPRCNKDETRSFGIYDTRAAAQQFLERAAGKKISSLGLDVGTFGEVSLRLIIPRFMSAIQKKIDSGDANAERIKANAEHVIEDATDCDDRVSDGWKCVCIADIANNNTLRRLGVTLCHDTCKLGSSYFWIMETPEEVLPADVISELHLYGFGM
jgi:hypothetical protein